MNEVLHSLAKKLARPPLRVVAAIPGVKGLLRPLAARSQKARWIFRSLPVEGMISLEAGDGTVVSYLSTHRDFIGRDLYWFGWDGLEPETTDVFLKLARTATTVVDVGANTGFFTLLAGVANNESRIITIEPVPRVCGLLRRNIELNDLDHRCNVVEAAVAESSGVVRFHVPHGVPTSASMHESGFRGHEGDLIEVQATTLDELCAGSSRVDLIKIDVEGFEDCVLKGAETVLHQSQPALVVECNPDGPYRRVEEILGDLGYSFFHLTTTGAHLNERIVPDPSEAYRNFLCVPRGSGRRFGFQVESGLLRFETMPGSRDGELEP